MSGQKTRAKKMAKVIKLAEDLYFYLLARVEVSHANHREMVKHGFVISDEHERQFREKNLWFSQRAAALRFLLSELQADALDAERYRFLRTVEMGDTTPPWPGPGVPAIAVPDTADTGRFVTEADADEHVDAAIAARDAVAAVVVPPQVRRWPGPGPQPSCWSDWDGTIVYRSYSDYVDGEGPVARGDSRLASSEAGGAAT